MHPHRRESARALALPHPQKKKNVVVVCPPETPPFAALSQGLVSPTVFIVHR